MCRPGDELFNQYLNNLRQFYQPNARIQSPSHRLKASLISLAVFGHGNPVVAPNDEARETFEGFTEVLGHVLPADLGFRRIAIRMPEGDSGDGDRRLLDRCSVGGGLLPSWTSPGRFTCGLAQTVPSPC